MTFDRTEQLIRDAFADEAARAVDSREVLANLRQSRPPRRYGLALATAAVVVVVAAVATFVVPKVFERSAPQVGDGQRQSATVSARNVVVVGVDEHGYSDSIVLVQVRADGSVMLLSLPRDTWVQSPEGERTKLNQVYVGSGAGPLLDTVRALTGVAAQNYAVVDTAAVAGLADAVGGVPVCLLNAVSDESSGAEFRAGEQIVTGPAALAFLRQRRGLPNGDFDRMLRLQAFGQALVTKLRGTDVTAALDTVRNHVETDPALDLLGFAQDLAGATEVRFGTLPVADSNLSTPEGTGIVPVDPGQVEEYLDYVAGTPPVTGDVPCVN